MKKIDIAISHTDNRGDIIDLVSEEVFNAATIVNFKKGAVRGNHYHKRTTQWNYLISGRLKILTQMPDKKVFETIINKGELFVILPDEHHTLKGIENSTLLVLTKGPRGGKEYESDTFRLKCPLKINEIDG